ncbi:DUF2062 domain-containing protein [bacterium]|nr:DUF2062 domain-containing protein [bacterium]
MPRYFNKFRVFLVDLLREGKTAQELSMAITLGCLFGLFPIIGITTVLCLVTGKVMKLNLPVMLTANYVVFPFQLFLIYVLIKTGELMFSIETGVSYEFFNSIMEQEFAVVVNRLGKSLLAAMFSWMLFSTVLFFPLYYLFLFVINRLKISRLFRSH